MLSIGNITAPSSQGNSQSYAVSHDNNGDTLVAFLLAQSGSSANLIPSINYNGVSFGASIAFEHVAQYRVWVFFLYGAATGINNCNVDWSSGDPVSDFSGVALLSVISSTSAPIEIDASGALSSGSINPISVDVITTVPDTLALGGVLTDLGNPNNITPSGTTRWAVDYGGTSTKGNSSPFPSAGAASLSFAFNQNIEAVEVALWLKEVSGSTPEGGSQSPVQISSQASGHKLAKGASIANLFATPEGSGSNPSGGGSQSSVSSIAQASGFKIASNGSISNILCTPQGSTPAPPPTQNLFGPSTFIQPT